MNRGGKAGGKTVITPDDMPLLEGLLPPLLPGFLRRKGAVRINLGAPLSSLAAAQATEAAKAAAERGELYIVERSVMGWRAGQMHAVLRRSAGPSDVMAAYVHAVLLAGKGGLACPNEAAAWMQGTGYKGFCKAIKDAGWDLSRVHLAPGTWRAEWGPEASTPDHQKHE